MLIQSEAMKLHPHHSSALAGSPVTLALRSSDANGFCSGRPAFRALTRAAATFSLAAVMTVAAGPSAASAAEGSPPKAAVPPAHPNGPQAAADDMAKLKPASGVEATLFACEPMLVNPADMDVDERGRVWVTEGANYRSTFQKWGILRPGGDRIVVLEDTNNDHKADRSTVFYQDLTINTALGICVLGNKVIVSSSPYVFVLTDTDGDTKADKRELLFEDTSKGDHDHCTHAFVFGPDGKLYFNFGNEVRELRRPKGGTLALALNGPVPKHESETVIDLAGNPVKTTGQPYRQGMAFRCNLDGSAVESIGWNFRNNYELAVDSFGTVWQSDNDDDGNRGVRINYVMEFGNYGFTDELTGAGWSTAWKKAQSKGVKDEERPKYHWHLSDPGVVPNLLQTGNGSPTGLCIYEGTLLPEPFRNQMLHCDAGPRVVRAYPVKEQGAGYSATMENLLTSDDAWYRPADVCVAPDGSVYIADWHDAGVGGHNMADRTLETMTGRIYRVTAKGTKGVAPKLDLTTAAGCVAALQSPNHATRYLAWTKLQSLGRTAEKELGRLWKDKDADPRQRARAVQLLARIPGREKRYVNQALEEKDANLRIVGLRMARALKMDVVPIVKSLAKDTSPQVRRECLLALRHHPSPEAPKLWTTLASQYDGKDRWYLEALGIAMDRQHDKFFGAWLATVGDGWNTPAGREIVWRSRSTKAPALLAKVITDKATSTADKERFMRALDFIKGPEKDAALVEISTSLLN
jgi:putative membrane-bound dehydrogenase-like protein